jgi:hypothetical protein
MSIPQNLVNNLYTLYNYYGLSDDAYKLKIKYPKTEKTDLVNNGNLIIVNYNGLAPKKVEQIVTIPIDNAWQKYYNIHNDYRNKVIREFDLKDISAAFPKYEKYDNKIKSFIVEVTDIEDDKQKYSSKSYAVTDIGTIMEKTLLHDYGSTFYSRINSYVLAMKEIEEIRISYEQQRSDIFKQNLLKETKRKLLDDLRKETVTKINDIKTSLANLNYVDLKSWRSLPATINMANLNLKPAKYTGQIKYLDAYGNVVDIKDFKVKIRKGRNRFVIAIS